MRAGLNVFVRLFVTYYAMLYEVLLVSMCLCVLVVLGCNVCELVW